MSRRPTRLVIDASIAGKGSQLCREFLHCVLNSDCHIAMTSELTREWNRHETKYSLIWRKSMTARKRVLWLADAPNDALRKQMSTSDMLKDAHLLEAALVTDKRIASNDERARSDFRGIPLVRLVLWINPAIPDENA